MNQSRTPEEIAHLWFGKMWNERDRDLLHELMAPEATGSMAGGQVIVGIPQFIEFQNLFYESLPDLRLELVNCLADGEQAFAEWQATGTHTGHGMNLTPTGKKVSFEGVTWFRVKDGQLVEGRDFWNQAQLIQTLSTPLADR